MNSKKDSKLKKKKSLLKNIKNFFLNIDILKVLKSEKKNYIYLIIFSIPFLVLDFSLRRLFFSKVKDSFYFVPILFDLVWCLLLVGTSIFTNKKIGKRIYIVFYVIALLFFLINGIYYSKTSAFFDFILIESASEGSEYFLDTIISCNIWVYIIAILDSLLVFFLLKKKFPKKKYSNKNMLVLVLLSFILLHHITPIFYGRGNSELTWDTWRNKRNIYINFNDDIQGMKITGLYEYTSRNFYITYLKKKKTNDEKELAFLENVYSEENDTSHSNGYTGLFKDKNLIFLQLEGIDDWVLTKDNMPNLYNLYSNSISFNNHYSYYNGGGSTFNSEFAINTGYITPLSYTQNAYSFNKNLFNQSMANLFKNAGYTVNAFHMNTKEYYSRGINYANWGFNNYYGLKDLGTYTDNSYNLDTELILNEEFYDLIFKNENKFVDYIITYSLHMPFSNQKGVCKQILDKNGENDLEITYSEEECIKIQAKETDDMVGLLIQGLKDNDLYNNTVIVAFADHYLYTIDDKTILDNHKNTSNNLINKTPLFIFSSNTRKTSINKVTSQLNILPTVLNLFGIEHNDNYYIGEDVLDPNYNGLVFFSDFSWYDGNIYFDNTIEYVSETLEEKNNYINFLIKKNDLTLKNDYFKTINNNKKASN